MLQFPAARATKSLSHQPTCNRCAALCILIRLIFEIITPSIPQRQPAVINCCMNIIVNKRVGGLARTIFTLLAASSQNLRPSASSSVASAFSDTRIDNTRSVGQISYRCNRHRCSITDRNQNCSYRRFCTRNNHQISKQVQQKQHRTKLNTMSASTNNENQGDAAFAPMPQPPKHTNIRWR